MAENNLKKGTFYAVGVGPGDPELLTLKAVRLLQTCPVIAAPRTGDGAMLALDIARGAVPLERREILPLDFTMKRGREEREAAYEKSLAALRPVLDSGRDVAMVNLGDVSIYASCQYLLEVLKKEGYPTVMVPGVPSFCAVAARLGQGLTDMKQPLHIAPGSVEPEKALEWPGNKVLMKSGKSLPAVLQALEARGLLGRSALVSDCGLPGEQVWTELENSRPTAEQAGYFTTVIVKED